MIYFYSFWLFIWSILYYNKIIKYQPLYEILIFALVFSISSMIYFNIHNINIYILQFIFHFIPIILVNNYNHKYNTIFINIFVLSAHIIFMNYNNINIIDYYIKNFKNLNNYNFIFNIN